MKTGDPGKTGDKDLLTAGLIIGGSWLLNELFGGSESSTQQQPTMTPEQQKAYNFLLKQIYGMFPKQNPSDKPPVFNPSIKNMPDSEFNRLVGNVRFGGNQISKKYFGG